MSLLEEPCVFAISPVPAAAEHQFEAVAITTKSIESATTTTTPIEFYLYSPTHKEFSNLYQAFFTFDHHMFSCVYQFFEWCKFHYVDPVFYRNVIRNAGSNIALLTCIIKKYYTDDPECLERMRIWNRDYSQPIIQLALLCKFGQNRYLHANLMSTKSVRLVERPSLTCFYGCDLPLGRLLEILRDQYFENDSMMRALLVNLVSKIPMDILNFI